jgi:aminoglycoside phosphotransferase (APT) family kinase protein
MNRAPLPTEEQLERVSKAIGADSLFHERRIEGGLSCTMDVLRDAGTRMVLRRYGPWANDATIDPAIQEARALELLQRANVPAPAPIWIDSDDVFAEKAVVISYLDGAPDLAPANPFEWAQGLASVLTRIHSVRLEGDDVALFPPSAGEDIAKIQENPELVLEHPLGEALLRRRVMLGSHNVESEQVFSHTDYWPGNTLWRDGSLVAVVDWEEPAVGDREMDVAYCALDIRYLGMDRVADHFVASYRELSEDPLADLTHWEAVALCRPMPDIAQWVPAWVGMGRDISPDQARARYTEVLEAFLERTG